MRRVRALGLAVRMLGTTSSTLQTETSRVDLDVPRADREVMGAAAVRVQKWRWIAVLDHTTW
jgi:hypothetical protein